MDEWLSNTAGAGPGDGAFERFLTAALAAIITLVFSWRLLGEVSDSEREQAMRRYASSQAAGQYDASQHGISNEKLREVVEAFAHDRSKRLNESTATGKGEDGAGAQGDSVDDETFNIQDSRTAEQSHGLSQEDSHFLSELLRSSLETTGVERENSAGTPTTNETDPVQPELQPIECTPSTMKSDSGNNSSECPRLTDSSANSQVCPQSVSEVRAQSIEAQLQNAGINVAADDSDDDDDDFFQDYFDDDIEPRVLDSDEEFYYRTILEPIAEEVSGDDPSSSGDEWCDPEGNAEIDLKIHRNSVSPYEASPLPANTSSLPSIETLAATETIQTIHDLEIRSEGNKLNNGVEYNEVGVSDIVESGLSQSRVFDSYQQSSPEHTTRANGEADGSHDDAEEITDDSVSEESDDTVIMVFSTHNRGEENGQETHQNEIIFMEPGNYGDYSDLLQMEKIEDSDSDDDMMTHSSHYDKIRNNLTLIGSEDSEGDDYDDRGSWSDPDDNFKFGKPSRSHGYRDHLIDDFVKDSNESLTLLDDGSLSWKSLPKAENRPFKLDIKNFEFGGKTPVAYNDAPFSNASEDSPIGFTFVEVKDTFTEFSLRNYVRDKENFGPKSDSGIFTDSGEFLASNGEIRPSDSENEILTLLDLDEETCSQNEINLLDNGEVKSEQAEKSSPGDIDYDGSSRYEQTLNADSCSQSDDSARLAIDRSDVNDTNRSAAMGIEMLQITRECEDSIASTTTKNIFPESNEGSNNNLISFELDEPQSEITRTDSELDDIGVNEALRLLDDSYVPYLQTEMGPVEDMQTPVRSYRHGEPEQTRETCSTEGPGDLLRDSKGISEHFDRNERLARGICPIEYDDSLTEVMIEALSPTSKESYYSERRRFNYQEALILEERGNQVTTTTPTTTTPSLASGNDGRDYRMVTDTDCVVQDDANGTDITAIDLPVRWNRSDRSTSEPLQLALNHLPDIPERRQEYCTDTESAISPDYTQSVISAREIGWCDLEQGIASEKSQSQVNSTSTNDCDFTPSGLPRPQDHKHSDMSENSTGTSSTDVESDNHHRSGSVVLDESPVICLVVDDNKTDIEEDNVFTKSESENEVDRIIESESNVDRIPPVTKGPNLGTVVSKIPPRRYTPSKTYESLLKPTTARRYTSVLQKPVSTEKIHVNFQLPEKPVPKIRRRILASRNRFFSDENLCSLNDSFEEQFSERQAASQSPDRDPHHIRRRTASSPSSRQAYSVADITRLYSPTSRPHKPSIDQLHENCILSPERLAFIRSRAFSTESLPRSASRARQPSVASLVETDIDTGETTETPLFTETDLDVPFRLQTPPEKTVSMMDLRSGSRSRFAAKKKAAEERKKSKSLQQLGVNIGSLETDIDAPFPCDGSGVSRVPSVHELRVSKSLSKLNVPDWLKRSTVYRTGSSFILRRDSNASSISQWSSKSYGPLTTTRDSSRAGSTVTLSQPSPVVIRTRVTSSGGRLVGSPNLGSGTTNPEPKHVRLPSAKFRDKEKPSGLMPIPIVPFDELRRKFEVKPTTNGHPTVAREVVVTQTTVESKPVPPGILKQTTPDSSNRTEQWPMNMDLEIKTINKSPPVLRNRLPPPKITVTVEKNVSPKDKTSPGAFEKSVRFSPVLNRMELSTGPSVTAHAPKQEEVKSVGQPINGGAIGKKPILPPKPSRKLLKWKQSAPAKEEQTTPKPTPMPKPVPAEKPPSRIANLIRRFKETTV